MLGEPGDLGSLHTSSWNEVPLSSDRKGAQTQARWSSLSTTREAHGKGGEEAGATAKAKCQSPDFLGWPEVPTSAPVEEALSRNWAATDGSEGR